MSADAYFKQSQLGNSKWWTWPCVFWMMLMTWIIGQMVLTSGFGTIAADLDPELGQAYTEAAIASFENIDMVKMGLYSGGFLISSIAAFIFLLISYNTSGQAQKVTGIITGISIALSMLFLIVLAPMGMGGEELNAVLSKTLGISPLAFALMLLTFPAALIGLYLGQKLIHKRTITSLHTAFAKFRWGRAIRAFLVMWGILAVFAVLANFLMGAEFKNVFDPARFFKYAIISLLLLPIQSATEEIVFRGYLNKGLIHFLKNKWVVFTITSLLFMAMHLANPEAIKGASDGVLPIVMSGYFFFGFACCLLVWIDDGLESAIGVHAGNNTFAALFINYENSVLPTPSVYITTPDPVSDAISTIVVLGAAVAIIYWLNKRSTSAA